MHRHLKKQHHPFLGVVIALVLFFTAAGAILAAADRMLSEQQKNNIELAIYGFVKGK